VPNAQDTGCIAVKSHDSVVLTLAGKAKELALAVHGTEKEIKRQLELIKAEAQKTCYTIRESKKPYILQNWSSQNSVGINQGSECKAFTNTILIAAVSLTNRSRWHSLTISTSPSYDDNELSVCASHLSVLILQ
jgi:hypothetical protein